MFQSSRQILQDRPFLRRTTKDKPPRWDLVKSARLRPFVFFSFDSRRQLYYIPIIGSSLVRVIFNYLYRYVGDHRFLR